MSLGRVGDRSLDAAQPYSVTFSSSYRVGQSSVVKRGKFSRKWFCQSWHYHDWKHFQCWSLCHPSQCMCTHPSRANIRCHADSCPPSLPEVKQWYLPMVSFVFYRRTYCGRILSVRGRKVLGDMKYSMRSVKLSAQAVGIWTEDNWDVNTLKSLYSILYGRFIFKRNKIFDSSS